MHSEPGANSDVLLAVRRVHRPLQLRVHPVFHGSRRFRSVRVERVLLVDHVDRRPVHGVREHVAPPFRDIQRHFHQQYVITFYCYRRTWLTRSAAEQFE